MTEERDYVAEATQQGWKPKDQFNGPEDKFTDAQTFVEKGEKISGILKSKVDRLAQEVQELRGANKEFGEYQKQLRQKERQSAEQRIAELEKARAVAVTEGDGTEFTRLDREIQGERNNLSVQPEVSGEAAIEAAWAQSNAWYGRDPALTAFADGVSGMVEAEGYNGKARLEEIARRTRETFPDKFENPNRNSSNGVEQGGEIVVENAAAHTYENLPDDAKAACDRFVSNGLTTKEDYLASYEWE